MTSMMIESRTTTWGMRRTAAVVAMLFLGAACETQSAMPDGGISPDRASPDGAAAGTVEMPGSSAGGSAGGGGSVGGTSGGPTNALPSVSGEVAPAEATPDCPVTLKPPAIGAAVTGRLCERNPAGQCKPISHAQVAYHVRDVAPVCIRGRTTTGPDGRFRIAGIEPADFRQYAVLVLAAGYLQTAESGFSPREGEEDELGDLELAPSASGTGASSFHRSTIAGRVCARDALQKCLPLAGATVGYRLSRDTVPAIIAQTRSDAEGRFTIPGVEPALYAHYTVSVMAKGHEQGSERADGLVPGGAGWHDVDLAIAAEGVESVDLLTGTLAGTVCRLNSTGCAPVANADVALLENEEVAKSARTDAKGRFGFSGIAPDARTFTVRCQSPDQAAMARESIYGVQPGATALGQCTLGQ